MLSATRSPSPQPRPRIVSAAAPTPRTPATSVRATPRLLPQAARPWTPPAAGDFSRLATGLALAAGGGATTFRFLLPHGPGAGATAALALAQRTLTRASLAPDQAQARQPIVRNDDDDDDANRTDRSLATMARALAWGASLVLAGTVTVCAIPVYRTAPLAKLAAANLLGAAAGPLAYGLAAAARSPLQRRLLGDAGQASAAFAANMPRRWLSWGLAATWLLPGGGLFAACLAASLWATQAAEQFALGCRLGLAGTPAGEPDAATQLTIGACWGAALACVAGGPRWARLWQASRAAAAGAHR